MIEDTLLKSKRHNEAEHVTMSVERKSFRQKLRAMTQRKKQELDEGKKQVDFRKVSLADWSFDVFRLDTLLNGEGTFLPVPHMFYAAEVQNQLNLSFFTHVLPICIG